MGPLAVASSAAGPAASIAITTLLPASIVADGASQATVIATVKDASSVGVAGESVSFSSTDPGEQISPATDNGDGTYTATITSSRAAGTPTITATDNSAGLSSPGVTLTQTAGPAASVSVSASPTSIPADGSTPSTLTATVHDTNGNPVVGESIRFSSNLTGTSFAAATGPTNTSGQYSTTVTGTTAGTATITADDTAASLSNTTSLTLTAGAAASVSTPSLSANPIVANGTSTTTATVTVTDAHGNPLTSETVTFSPTPVGGQGAVIDNGNGTYSATIASTTTAGNINVTASDGGLTSPPATLTQVAGPATTVSVSASPTSIPADGSTHATVTATARDANGNPVAGDSIHFSSNLGNMTFAAATGSTDAFGQYSTTVTGTTAGSATITADDTTAGHTNATALTLTAGAAASIAVAFSQNPIAANGSTPSTITVTVLDVHGNPVQGNSIHLTSSLTGTSIAAATGSTDAFGQYSTTITGTHAGTATITATDNSAGGLNNGASLVFSSAQPQNIGLQPLSSLTADGVSSTTEVATVTDMQGNPISGEHLSFSATPAGVGFNPSSGTTNAQGKLTVTITSSTVAGVVTVTATDVTTPSAQPASTSLTLTPGPAATVAVSLSPAAIVANGSATATATATVTDAHGNAIPSDSVAFSSSDPGDVASGTTANGNGTYTATIRSSTTVGTPTITATDDSVGGLSGHATLAQTAAGSSVALSVNPIKAVTNQPVTLAASVQSTSGTPTGGVTFSAGATAIPGCVGLAVSASGSVGTAACVTSFAAASPPGPITATFNPSTSASLGSTSAAVSLSLSPASTSVTLSAPSTAKIGARVRYTASVTTSSSGPVAPGGPVTFYDGATAIAKCTGLTLASGVATCSVVYPAARTHLITARYAGDGDFAASSSAANRTNVLPAAAKKLPYVTSTMTWSFLHAKTYSQVISLVVSHGPAHGTVVIACTGRGCPYATHRIAVPTHRTCTRHGHKHKHKHTCTARATSPFDITSALRSAKLAPGAKLVVELTRKGYNGKYYRFAITARGPKSMIACIAPHHTKPNHGCTLH